MTDVEHMMALMMYAAIHPAMNEPLRYVLRCLTLVEHVRQLSGLSEEEIIDRADAAFEMTNVSPIRFLEGWVAYLNSRNN